MQVGSLMKTPLDLFILGVSSYLTYVYAGSDLPSAKFAAACWGLTSLATAVKVATIAYGDFKDRQREKALLSGSVGTGGTGAHIDHIEHKAQQNSQRKAAAVVSDKFEAVVGDITSGPDAIKPDNSDLALTRGKATATDREPVTTVRVKLR